MASSLTDLDELILRCRNDTAKTYIAEAVASYKVGALRAAIVGAWIAVCFDFIDKLHELSLAGDKEATHHVEELEQTRKSGDVSKALKFEKSILELARDKFELISHLEYIDLERLQADRNRCAHPSLTSDEQVYSPSAELARTHIHAAVVHLLQHHPAQGKYALERLLKNVESEFFPTDAKKAETVFSSGPLRKPRSSLTRNFTLLLIKRLLTDDLKYKAKQQIAAALSALNAMHPLDYSATFGAKLSPVLRTLADDDLLRVTTFVQLIPDCWQFIDEDIRHRIQNFVEELPGDAVEDLPFFSTYAPLKGAAEVRIRSLSREEVRLSLFFNLPEKLADRLIELYLTSSSFDQANAIGKDISFHADTLSVDQVKRIILNAQRNDQLLYSFELGPLLIELRKFQKIPIDEFDALLNANGLSRFSPATPQP